MNKEELYQQIEAFNNTLTDSTDKSSKTYQEARFYVNNIHSKLS
jgi:ribosomal protein L1